MNQQMLMQQHQILMLLIPQHLQRPPLSPQTSEHSAPSLTSTPAYPMQHMLFQPQYPMPVYQPQMASPSGSHITPGIWEHMEDRQKALEHREDQQKALEHMEVRQKAGVLLNSLLVFLTTMSDYGQMFFI
ncbi:hypothetical protein C1H46_042315 [Malus baccata]|uniref:Uncharacterized protein n=1 Tax=Malus baccata TaxID=106549 RepID=A0A540KD57_MALBA|nr:hypothetical protein C1H46_042315 [Malus baccata]